MHSLKGLNAVRRQMKTTHVVMMLALSGAGTLAAQEPPTPPAAPAPAAAPAVPVAPTPAWAQGQDAPRRGWFGIQLSCEECFVQRGNGRVSYAQRPAISWVEANSPAYTAGLHSGDTITAVDGFAITTPE